jgi:hypothetical protein
MDPQHLNVAPVRMPTVLDRRHTEAPVEDGEAAFHDLGEPVLVFSLEVVRSLCEIDDSAAYTVHCCSTSLGLRLKSYTDAHPSTRLRSLGPGVHT